MRFMLSEDLGNVNPGHEFICMYVCMWNVIACDVDVDDVIMMMYVVYVHGGCDDHVGYP